MEKIKILKDNNVDVDASLEFWGDLDSYNESLKEFLDSLDSKLANLEYYMNNADWENYAILAHSIKSESKYLGFMNEAQVFLEHELKGKENNGDFIKNNFNNLKDTVNKMTLLLNDYFKDIDSKKCILVADDSSIILNFIDKNINNEYKTIKAQNGKEAIDAINNNNIYAILLDLNMPLVNGFKVLEFLNENNLKIPVIVITGDDTEETIKKAFNYPIVDVLNKPFNEDNLNRILVSIDSFYDKK